MLKRIAITLILFLLGSCAGPQQPRQQEIPAVATMRTIPPAAPPEGRREIYNTLTPPIEPQQSLIFPHPPQLETQVAFWRNVYSHWGLAQIALHDNKHLGLVYEVVELPGAVKEGYTPAQEQFIKEKRSLWEAQLDELEQKLRAEAPLTAQEKALTLKIAQTTGSKEAIYGSSERLRAQRGLRERFKRGLEISGRYHRAISDIFRNAGLPEDLAYLPHVESSFQAHARSSAGAVGIWQFTGSAAKTFMTVDESIDERLDPIIAAHGAARYLKHAYNKLGSWPLALTSYNHGIGGMSKAKERYGHDFDRMVKEYDHPQFGFASRNFYAEYLAARDIARQPQTYFPEGIRYEQPLEYNRIVLDRSLFISDIARKYQVDLTALNAINPAWSDKARAGKVAVAAGTQVWLPAARNGQKNIN
jgi:membrane-bound lytic murein transglycosylase D